MLVFLRHHPVYIYTSRNGLHLLFPCVTVIIRIIIEYSIGGWQMLFKLAWGSGKTIS